MGTHTAGQDLPKQANRVELFKAAAVPKIITIKVDDIRDEKGALIAPSQAITLHSSDRKDGPVKIKLSEDILTWLKHAILHSWSDVPAVEDTKLHDIIHSRLTQHAPSDVIICTVTATTVTLKRKRSCQQLSIPREHFYDLETIEDSVERAVAALEVVDKKRKRNQGAGSSHDDEVNDE